MTIWFATGNAHKKTELSAILKTHGVDCRLLIPKDAGLDFDPEETGTSFHENALLKANELYILLEKARPALYSHGDMIIADDSGICVDALDGRPGIYSARYMGQKKREEGKEKKEEETGNNSKKLEASERNSLLLEDAEGARRSAAFSDLCDSAGAQRMAAVCEKRREGFSPSGGRMNNAQKLEASERNALLLEELGNAANRKARFVCAMVLMYSPDRFFVAQETVEGELVKDMEHAFGAGGFGYDPIFFIPELGRTAAELSEDEKNMISHRGKAGKIIAGIICL